MEENDLQDLIKGLDSANKNLETALDSVKKLVTSRNSLKSEIENFNKNVSSKDNTLKENLEDLNQSFSVFTNTLDTFMEDLKITRKNVKDSQTTFQSKVLDLKKKNEEEHKKLSEKIDLIIKILASNGFVSENEDNNELPEEKETTSSISENKSKSIEVTTFDYVRKNENSNEPLTKLNKRNKTKSIVLKGKDDFGKEYEFRCRLYEGETLTDINSLLTNKKINIIQQLKKIIIIIKIKLMN